MSGYRFCKGRFACVDCRTDSEWRKSLFRAGLVESADFACPFGIDRYTALAEQTNALVALATTQEQLTAIGKRLRQSSKSCCGKAQEDN
jgi:hypothetical protein